MSSREEYVIFQQVVGADKVEDLSEKLKKAKQDLLDLIAAEQAAGRATDLTNSAIQSQTQAVLGLSNGLKAAQSELKQVKTDAAQLGTQVGYLADDLQQFKNGAAAGMQAISNNLQPILQSIGPLSSFAPYITIAAIAAAQLYEHWDELLGIFGSGKVKSEAEEMAELGKNTKRTADEEERYQRLKDRAKHADAQHDAPDARSQFEKNVDDAIKNGPVEDIEKGIDKYYGDTIRKMADLDPRRQQVDEEFNTAQKQYDYSVKNRGEGEDTDRARQRLGAAQDARNGLYADARTRFMADLGKNPALVGKVAERAAQNPKDFGPNGEQFAQDLKDASKSKAQKKKDKEVEEAVEEASKIAWDAELDLRKMQAEKAKEVAEAEKEAADIAFDAAHDIARAIAKQKEQEVAEAVKEAGDIAKSSDKWIKDNDRQKERARKDARDRAKQNLGDIPGLSDDLQANLLKRQMGGMDNRRAQVELSAEIAAQLREQGVSASDAAELAKEQVGNANKSLMEDLMKPQQAKNSEVLDAGASFAAKIQSSISSDSTQKSQLEQLKELVRLAKRGQTIIPTFQ